MKRYFGCLLFFMFLFTSCVTPGVYHLRENGDYIDVGITHTVEVKQVSTLNEFGISYSEWENFFGDSLVYRAYSAGNAYASSNEVENRAYDAIEIVGNNLNACYVALLGQDIDKKTSIQSSTNYNTTTVWDGSRSITITTPTTTYTDVNKYSFACYAIYFNDEDILPNLRTAFGKINVYRVR